MYCKISMNSQFVVKKFKFCWPECRLFRYKILHIIISNVIYPYQKQKSSSALLVFWSTVFLVFIRRMTRTGNWWTGGFPETGTTSSCQPFRASSSRSRCPTWSRVWTSRHNTRLRSRPRTGSAGTRRARRSSFTPEELVSNCVTLISSVKPLHHFQRFFFNPYRKNISIPL